MDAAQIAAMIADREAGTPGSLVVDGPVWNQIVWTDNKTRFCFMAHSNGLNDERDKANARRIARVPDMEATIIAQAAELERLREAMGNNCNALTDADCAYLIAHLSYELEPVGKPPTWNQLAMEVIRLSNALALKGGAA